uniref:Apple domain-containing protein n=2 Tax=Magallana TaxID=2171616 RepID=A0A8W8M9J1_MAGGI
MICSLVRFGLTSLAVFGTLQLASGHLCNLYDVTSSHLTSLTTLTTSECGFNCGVTSGCMNFGVCHDSSSDNCTFYKTVSKTSCGPSSSVLCFLFTKDMCESSPCTTVAQISTAVTE